MKKKSLSITLSIVGILLAAGGFVILKTIDSPQGVMRVLPYLILGIGCGVFGHGMGDLFSSLTYQKHPDLAKQMEIERGDERNVAIANKAKAKAYDVMIFLFGALMVCFALMEVELTAILLLVFAYLFVVGLSIYYRCKFEKEM